LFSHFHKSGGDKLAIAQSVAISIVETLISVIKNYLSIKKIIILFKLKVD